MEKEVLMEVKNHGGKGDVTVMGNPKGFDSEVSLDLKVPLGTTWAGNEITEDEVFRSLLSMYLSDCPIEVQRVHPSFEKMKDELQSYTEFEGTKYPNKVFDVWGNKGCLQAITKDGYRYYFGNDDDFAWCMAPDGSFRGSVAPFVVGALVRDFKEGNIAYWGSKECEAYIKELASD